MFIVHELVGGYVCEVHGETPNKDDILCLDLCREGVMRFKVREIVRYAEQTMNGATLGGYVVKAMVERIETNEI